MRYGVAAVLVLTAACGPKRPPPTFAPDPGLVEQIREILDELGVRGLIDAEITAQRGRAIHALQGIATIAAAHEPLDLLERLVASTTGAATEAAGAVAT